MTTKRRPPDAGAVDDHGALNDGAIAILDTSGEIRWVAPAAAVDALRLFSTTVEIGGVSGLPNVLALTSALRGEGVSFVARALAAVTAYDTEASVVLVDLNWSRPDVPARPESRRHRGRSKAKAASPRPLMDPDWPTLQQAIESGTPVRDIIQATGNPRLSMVAPGALTLARRHAVASGAGLEAVVGELASSFDHVVLDLPAVLASGDTIRLSYLADAYALVVRQGVTTTRQVEVALEALRGVATAGVILNRYRTQVPRRLRRLVGA